MSAPMGQINEAIAMLDHYGEDELGSAVKLLYMAANAIYERHGGYCPMGSWRTPGHDVILREWDELADALNAVATVSENSCSPQPEEGS